MQKRCIQAALMLLAVAPLAACDALNGEDPGVSMSFAAPRSFSGSAAVLASDPISDGTHTLDLQSVEVVFDEITLEHSEDEAGGDSDGESDADSDSDGSANEKLRRGPYTVSLPVSGGVVTPINESLPAGRYEKVELDVSFVRVRGTYDGQAFDVTLPVNEELELEFDTPFVVDDDADRLNVTIQIAFADWFRSSNGTLIDPRPLATNSSLRSEVVRNIRDSFNAFEDSDKDADDQDSDSDSDGR